MSHDLEQEPPLFTALYNLLNALTTFDKIDLAHITLASPAAAWEQAIVQGIEACQQLEALMDFWAHDLNNAIMREQEAQGEEQYACLHVLL